MAGAFLVLGLLLGAGSRPVVAADAALPPRVWQVQDFPLRAGWSAIYSHVDVPQVSLDVLAQGNPDIEEIWRWNPEISSLQFLESPDRPTDSPGNWMVWRRNGGDQNTLQNLSGNVAYLVKLRTGAGQFQWSVKGAPVPIQYNWKSDGMNLIGFATVAQNPPNFADFLAPAPRLLLNTPIYQYRGGDLGPANPLQLLAHRTTPVRRGEAFWVRASDAVRYYGPFEIQLQDKAGIHFGDRLGAYELTLRNVSAAEVTVQANLLPSDGAPAGAEALANGTPTLVLRGDLNKTTLNHAYLVLDNATPRSWTLKPAGEPGSEITLVLGMDWSRLAGSAGTLNGGILRFTDGAAHVRYDIPVTARVPDAAGLWVGDASITHVQEDLKAFRKSSDQGTAKSLGAGPVTLTWIKRVPEAGTPPDSGDTAKWHAVEGLYFRKATRSYAAAGAGEELAPPATDENGLSLPDPGSYWQARPLDPTFAAGYYFDEGRDAPVANGYQHLVTLVWEKAAGVVNPANGTYPATQEARHEGVLVGQVLPRPAFAALDVTPAFWNPRPADASEAPPYEYDPTAEAVSSRITGDVTVVWLKSEPSSGVPPDAQNLAKWHLDGAAYYLKFETTYVGTVPGDFLEMPTSDESGQSLPAVNSYWQPRPYHPSFITGFHFDAGTGKPVANGFLEVVRLTWLRAADPDPSLGESKSYVRPVAGQVLEMPAQAHPAVDASHWVARPLNAPGRPNFDFTPSGESYQVTSDGRYIQTSASQGMAKTAKAMPLRLILHSAPTGGGQYSLKLLQRVYFGTDASGMVVLATQPSKLGGIPSQVRRMSSVHVPWSPDNRPIPCVGNLRFGASGEITISHADPIANPFVHAYHPDHDNLDARYEKPVGMGEESHGVRRMFTLTPAAATPDFESVSRGGDTLPGVYEERIRLEGKDGHSKEYRIRGTYLLRRIASNPDLLVP